MTSAKRRRGPRPKWDFVPNEGARLLGDVLLGEGKTLRDLAAALEVDPSYISRCVRGQLVPTLEIAFRLEDLTDGNIPARSWLIKPRTVFEASRFQ